MATEACTFQQPAPPSILSTYISSNRSESNLKTLYVIDLLLLIVFNNHFCSLAGLRQI